MAEGEQEKKVRLLEIKCVESSRVNSGSYAHFVTCVGCTNFYVSPMTLRYHNTILFKHQLICMEHRYLWSVLSYFLCVLWVYFFAHMICTSIY